MIFTNDLSPIMAHLGPLSVHWYGVMFALGLVLSYLVTVWVFKREKVSILDLESLVMYLFFGLVIGARLGEVFFYNPGYYLGNPVEILKIWEGGLASHGAAIGLFVSFLLWARIHKKKFSKYTDLAVIAMPLAAGFVRVGNYFNSEIVGKASGENYGVIFARLGEDFARHPVQLYAALMNWVVFAVLVLVYLKYYKKSKPYFMTFLYVLLYFSGRFIVEFWKDFHVLPESFPLSMGQVLSLIPILIAVGWFARMKFRKA